MALTAKKKLFADAILAGKSQTDAAIEAGYSAKTATAAASRLVNKDPDVIAYLAAHKKRGKRGAQEREPVDPELKRVAAAVGFDVSVAFTTKDALEFLIAAFNDPSTEPKLRIDAAKAVVPYQHAKKEAAGKKDAKTEAAKKAASKFGALAPPLKLVNGK